MNRRVFLRGIGGVSLAAPFLPSVAEQEAKAQTHDPAQASRHLLHPQRLPHRPLVAEGATYTNGAATLTADMLKGQTLEPLTPYISKLLVPRGFRSMNALRVGPVDRSRTTRRWVRS